MKSTSAAATVDIGKRVRSWLKKLEAKNFVFNGVEIPDIEIESKADWNPDYAILCNVRPDVFDVHSEYFDEGSFFSDLAHDLVKHLKNRTKLEYGPNIRVVFENAEIKVTKATRKKLVSRTWVKPGTIIVRAWTRSGELEVYRV